MARVKRGVTQRARHKKILDLAKGFHSGRSRLHKTANEAVLH
jgi:large subunit ribosomal protein L20